MAEKLYRKTSSGYEEVYNLNYIKNIIDSESSKSLTTILGSFNNIYIPYQDTVENTRNLIPKSMRRKGLWITYNNGTKYITEYYKGNLEDIQEHWTDSLNWQIIPDLEFVQSEASKLPDGIITPDKLSPALQELIKQNNTVTNLPDDEDLQERNGVLSLKDRRYNHYIASGKGYKILRKNWVKSRNILTQDMISAESTIYEIRYDFDLNGGTINIPDNCILYFKGGTFRNGTLFLRNTFIIPNSPTIEDSIIASIKGAYIEGQLNYDKGLNTIKWYSGGKWNTLEGVKYGPTSERPVLNDSNNSVQLYYDTTINSLIYWNLSEWIDTRDRYSADILRIGYSDNRPSLNSTHTGFKYFDLDLNAYITWTGTKWIDINGYNPGERNSDGTLITKEIII